MSFAIIETGGKQYRISEGEILKTEKIPGDFKEGDKVTFDKVLLMQDGEKVEVGTPYLEGVTIEAVFEKEGKGKKLHIIKFRPKSRYSKKIGHRQPFTQVKIGKVGKAAKSEKTEKVEKKPATAK
ncbi:MAG TPA: 50S ribosomal protein L21 [Candidatus Paceibacterota bacterium]|nr:50S ribosomal protein L21 [Candidatus Paceibacterota bacterium]